MSDAAARPALTIYRRPGCHLCDDAEVMLREALAERAGDGLPGVDLRRVDVSPDADLERRYGQRIPVFAVGDDEIELVISRHQIDAFLRRVLPVLM